MFHYFRFHNVSPFDPTYQTHLLLQHEIQGKPGLFPGKSAATVSNNKIELFEKAKGQGPGSFRLLGFRFLGYERPSETLKWEHLTINKHSSEG